MKTLEYKALAGPIVTVVIRDPTSITGAGLTGKTNASSGLVIAIRPDNAATTTGYSAAGSTVDTIATLGTWAAPTSGHCRFKEIDSTNHPGHYELQFAAALWATAGARKLVGTIQVTGGAQTDFEIQLTGPDVSASAGGTGALLQFGAGAGQINAATGKVPATIASGDDADAATIKTTIGVAGAGLTGVALAAAGLDAVVIETGVNARQALSPILAASAGVVLGMGTGTVTLKGGNVATTRISATTDSAGNRTSVTLTLPS